MLKEVQVLWTKAASLSKALLSDVSWVKQERTRRGVRRRWESPARHLKPNDTCQGVFGAVGHSSAFLPDLILRTQSHYLPVSEYLSIRPSWGDCFLLRLPSYQPVPARTTGGERLRTNRNFLTEKNRIHPLVPQVAPGIRTCHAEEQRGQRQAGMQCRINRTRSRSDLGTWQQSTWGVSGALLNFTSGKCSISAAQWSRELAPLV